MTAQTKRATIYFDPMLHKALRHQSAETERSISELVNEAVRSSLSAGNEDIAAFSERAHEPDLPLEDLLFINEHAIPRVGKTGMKIIHLIMMQQAHGYSSTELHFQFPDLSMGEIHTALAYYWEHKAELDAAIKQHDQYVAQSRQDWGESRAVQRLRSSGHLS